MERIERKVFQSNKICVKLSKEYVTNNNNQHGNEIEVHFK